MIRSNQLQGRKVQQQVRQSLVSRNRQMPTAGALGALCEENYGLLMALMPTLRSMKGSYCARPSGHPALAINISEEGPYTQDLFMTHLFQSDAHTSPITLPDAHLRLYHDATLVEVQRFGKQMILPVEGLYANPGLQQKWRANLFLGRWLRYCLSSSYLVTEQNTSA